MDKGCVLCFHFIPQARWPVPASSKPWGVWQPSWAAPLPPIHTGSLRSQASTWSSFSNYWKINLNPQHLFSLLIWLLLWRLPKSHTTASLLSHGMEKAIPEEVRQQHNSCWEHLELLRCFPKQLTMWTVHSRAGFLQKTRFIVGFFNFFSL